MDSRDIINLQEAYLEIYAPQELTEEEQIAAEYFYEQGLNEDGVAILIEELGIDEFNDWVLEIVEDYNLTEWRRGPGGTRVRGSGMSKSGKQIKDLKGGAKASAIRATPEHKARKAERETTSSSSGMRDALRSQAATVSASKQKPTPKKEEPKQTQQGIGHLLRSAGQYVVNKGKQDLESVGRSMRTARQAGRQAEAGVQAGAKLIGKAVSGLRNTPEVTRARREVQVTLGRGAQRAGEFGKHAAAAAGAAAGTGVRLHRQGKTARQIASAAGGTFAKHLSDIYREEVEEFVGNLIDEGYDLSDYTWEDMYEIYEAAVADVPVRAKPQSSHNAMLSELIRVHGPKVGMQKFKEMIKKENYESILAYLVNEGYAKTVDSAERIMESMSEEWQDQILNEMPFQIYTYKNGQRVNVGKPYNFDPNNPESKKKARSRVRKRINNLDQDAGGYTHGYHETP